MKKIAFIIFFSLLFTGSNFAQDQSKVLLTIDGHEITKEEFLRIYNKNNQNLVSGEQTNLQDYLDLFINFKLKVLEAERLRIDTLPSVKNEIQKYREELAKPYLVDESVLDTLVKEAYNRSKKEVKASHILIKFPQKISYHDTAFTYKKANNIRKRIINKKQDFHEVARATSDDPAVKNNAGNIGYFTALQMVYPFETKVYEMETGQVSKPLRVPYGYHIIKKTGERKAKGKVKIAHIMLLAPKSMPEQEKEEQKEKINDLYHQLKRGADFAELARKHSDDKGSARQGGKLPWFGVGRMVPSFEEAAFSIDQVGQITQPIRTSVGWHILKLLDKREIGTFEQSKDLLTQKVTNNPRYQIARDSLIEELKDAYSFHINSGNLKSYRSSVLPKDDSLDLSTVGEITLSDSLIQFDDQYYAVRDFAKYLQQPPRQLANRFEGAYLFDQAFKEFTREKILEFEKEKLPEKYPEYKNITQEYHDGILLFEIMDRKVWAKASEDTTGLKEYFRNNREDYQWSQRFEGKIYFADNQEILKKVKKLKKGGLFRKSYSDKEIKEEFNSHDNQKVEIRKGIYLKGENSMVDNHAWGMNKKIEERRPYFIIGKKIPPQNKSLEEARGAVLADYQNYLEEQWIKRLRERYTIDVHQKVLNEIQDQ